MTTTTPTPFVNTPFGVGVVVCSDCWSHRKLYIRFEDGSYRWIPTRDCQLDAPRPDWYREPETADIPGYVR